MTTWSGLTPAVDTIATQVGLNIASLSASGLALRPFTIVRTRIELFIFSDQEAAVERQLAAFGMAVVSDQAVAVGLTALPTPASDLDSGLWLAHQFMFADAVNLTDRAVAGQKYTIDSKAMRKVDVGQDLVFMLENGSADGVKIMSAGRILIKTN